MTSLKLSLKKFVHRLQAGVLGALLSLEHSLDPPDAAFIHITL